MSVDTKRVQAVFLAAVEIADAAQRALYLDQECASDPDMRQRIDALLQAHALPASILARPVATPIDIDPVPSDCTLPLDSSSPFLGNPPKESDTLDADANEDDGPSPLESLQPSTKPGSLGRLGHYEVLEVLGEGGFGTVVRAYDEKLHRMIAIKIMAPRLAATSPARKRFLREARSSAAIRHENVVDIHAIEEQPIPFLVMEYVAGETLQQRLDRVGPLDTLEVLRIGVQIARGLAAAHAMGKIHRDIKPANILLENGIDRVKITDFGLARAADDASLTQSGLIAGTPMYMAPEQAQGVALDQRADLFSFGSVLYVMCSGRPPFRASTTLAVLKRVADDTPRPIREIIPEVPEWLCDIITKLHAKDPSDRFQTAQEVADFLGKYLTELQMHGKVQSVVQTTPKMAAAPATDPAPAAAQTRSILSWPTAPQRRGRGLAAAAGVLFCLIGGLAFTEATGVTKLRSTVVRIFTPDGSLVVEVDDPGVKVTVEGDGGLVITGAGLEEIGLRPGSYKVQAAKDGKPVRLDQELVKITRGDKQVVRVRLEGELVAGKIAANGEPGAFVLLGGKGVAERKFDTLADAVQGTSGGDTIEVRGNGPFMSAPINISRTALTIRAGAGFRPVFVHTTDGCLLASHAPLALEGLEFRSFGNKTKEGEHAVIQSNNAPLRIAHCRIWVTGPMMNVAADYSPLLEVRHSDLLAGNWGSFHWTPQDWGKLLINNCLMSMIGVEERKPSQGAEVELSNNTFVARDYIYQHRYYSDPADSEGKGDFRSVRVKAARNVFSCPLAFGIVMLNQEGAKPFRPDALADWCRGHNVWEASENLFDVNGSFLIVAEGILEGAKKQRVCKTIKDWQTFWKNDKAPGIDAAVRFVGGDLIDRVSRKLPSLIPEEFRLRPDSSGYKAGKDGKDLGADVDLVGPGPAYERWKKTPEYQQWLKDTKEVKKAQAAKVEAKAFVLLGGKGVSERKFDTLAGAVVGASDGDTIEVRGNGPFVTKPVTIGDSALTIRAGEGFRPVLRVVPQTPKDDLISTSGPLVLEGLEIRDVSKDRLPSGKYSIIFAGGKSLHLANCRLLQEEPSRAGVHLIMSHSTIHLRNCEFYGRDAAIASFGNDFPVRFVMDNCLGLGNGPITYLYYIQGPSSASVKFSRNTIAMPWGCAIGFTMDLDRPLAETTGAEKDIRFEMSSNLFDMTASMLLFERLEPYRGKEKWRERKDPAAVFQPLISWRDQGNFYRAGARSITWRGADGQDIPLGPTDRSGWDRFWGQTKTESLEGRIRYSGGDLFSRSREEADKIAPEDFRLRPDSPGYKAGKDGKDLGADVDLVGPGPAYERWRKTPEYQQWLKDSGQVKK